MVYAEAPVQALALDELFLSTPRKRVGLLGGTFNPIHNGHLDIARAAAQEFSLDKVLLVVSGDPPHKQDQSLAPKTMRLQMGELAAGSLPGSIVRASDIETKKDGVTYTVDTLRELSEKEPETDFLFIIGTDTLYQLQTWREIGRICRMTEFLCMGRSGEPDAPDPAVQIRMLESEYGAVIHSSGFTGPDISSTRIRERIRAGESISRLVPPAVEEYIYATGLYV